MELDKETLVQITETHTNVAHILDDLEEGREKFKEQDIRIGELEKVQQLLKGKITVIVLGIGTIVTVFCNLIFFFWLKLRHI